MTKNPAENPNATVTLRELSFEEALALTPPDVIVTPVFYRGEGDEDEEEPWCSYLRVNLPDALPAEDHEAVVGVIAAAVRMRMSPYWAAKVTSRISSSRYGLVELDLAAWSGNADEEMADAIGEVAEFLDARR